MDHDVEHSNQFTSRIIMHVTSLYDLWRTIDTNEPLGSKGLVVPWRDLVNRV